jgi:hypothetical protein
MGDRANVFVVDDLSRGTAELEGVYLYTHWGGSNLPATLAQALDSKEGRARWNDGPYLARIIFDRMTGLTGGELGFGISASICDNEYPILVVDPANQRVRMVPPGEERQPSATGWTFEEFVERRPGWER